MCFNTAAATPRLFAALMSLKGGEVAGMLYFQLHVGLKQLRLIGLNKRLLKASQKNTMDQ